MNGRAWGLKSGVLRGATLALLLLLAACSSVRPRGGYRVKAVNPHALVDVAKKRIGTPYRYGGNDPRKGFDCSGLVWWSYKELGSSIPREAHEQYFMGEPVAKGDWKAGDLVFFNTGGGRAPQHVAIVTDPPKFVHAPSTGGKVREDNLEQGYWAKHYYGARRIE